MTYISKHIQQLYEGFLQTPVLWKYNLNGIEQLKIEKYPTATFDENISKKLRLGKLVEQFVIFQLKNSPENYTIISSNLQIQDNNRTIGELDCLYQKNQKYFHLEIGYKFYLYKKNGSDNELEYWIGPNLKDNLVNKLNKLKTKQFPLAQNNITIEYLKKLDIDTSLLNQKVLLKAQLFIPYKQEITIEKLNKKCIKGFYCSLKELANFSDCKFYIPPKIGWLLKPTKQVDWKNYSIIKNELQTFIDDKFSPLCWMLKPNGELIKFFVVWWI